ncbi:pseudouridine-5'-phosphate glycosidase [Kibdelosporangium philippinense]|uniref:Pseudouridine-5'-phosphate glycosidase n=1 Tax=Kibdelosporangium philippinense TaxID=211113 RepID=A0ABS8ZPG1_9PSEU|nr:pseudouridine-5'-phosphate glycosidase [Kibdelosporangium philippinense]MCE7009649.1 pseudouridine-5'-phosphate glycosidase [Kibdelosporangium philippinense]
MTSIAIADEVRAALAAGQGVVALESTILSHGLPPGRNRKVAERLETVVREAGAIPATIAVLDGKIRVGLDSQQIDRVCAAEGLVKLSKRDLGPAIAMNQDGATTVASTAAIAHAAGIKVFGTGGLGGVHLPLPGKHTSWDVSADLDALAETPVLVVSSGVKSVLDIEATLELLETRSVPVIGYQVDHFPAFYLRESAYKLPWRVDTAKQAADIVHAHLHMPGNSGILLANPIPAEYEMDRELHDRLLADGVRLLDERGVQGRDVTPVLLEHFHTASSGVSLDANEALVVSNVTLAAQIAADLAARQ